jgi:hypothetical protein
MNDLDPTTNPDVQEALSRRYSDDIIMLLPLSQREGGPSAQRIAVFNNARELCAILPYGDAQGAHNIYRYLSAWHPPAAAPTLTKPPVDLEELDLI